MNRHNVIDQRSLAMHSLIAEKCRRDPVLINRARCTLDRWMADPSLLISDCLAWKKILDTWPDSEILRFLSEDSEQGRRLRQSSPFCGILSSAERVQVIKEYEAAST
jgi:hypothetical protein